MYMHSVTRAISTLLNNSAIQCVSLYTLALFLKIDNMFDFHFTLIDTVQHSASHSIKECCWISTFS